MDDILIASKTISAHCTTLESVLNCLRKNGLELRLMLITLAKTKAIVFLTDFWRAKVFETQLILFCSSMSVLMLKLCQMFVDILPRSLHLILKCFVIAFILFNFPIIIKK